MPELSWTFGYPMALLMMAASVAGLWVFFKKSGWL
jgi:magnesium transporter